MAIILPSLVILTDTMEFYSIVRSSSFHFFSNTRLSEIHRDIRTSTYQISRIEKIKSNNQMPQIHMYSIVRSSSFHFFSNTRPLRIMFDAAKGHMAVRGVVIRLGKSVLVSPQSVHLYGEIIHDSDTGERTASRQIFLFQ